MFGRNMAVLFQKKLLMNLTEIKKDLQELGISTNTPGLVGDERYEELKFRLEKAQKANSNREIPYHDAKSTEAPNDQLESMDFALLTIGELRSRLSSLGISTSTPGLNGQERFQALKQRLIDAICSNSNENDEASDDIVVSPKQGVSNETISPKVIEEPLPDNFRLPVIVSLTFLRKSV
jgi:hypothetical protein